MTDEALEDYYWLPLVIRSRVAGVFAGLENWPMVSGAKPPARKVEGAILAQNW